MAFSTGDLLTLTSLRLVRHLAVLVNKLVPVELHDTIYKYLLPALCNGQFLKSIYLNVTC
jgi:hypothetical protein